MVILRVWKNKQCARKHNKHTIMKDTLICEDCLWETHVAQASLEATLNIEALLASFDAAALPAVTIGWEPHGSVGGSI